MMIAANIGFGWRCVGKGADKTPLGERHEASMARRRVVLGPKNSAVFHIRRGQTGG